MRCQRPETSPATIDHMANEPSTTLWELNSDDGTTRCVMVSCCSGAELQVVRERHSEEEIVLRELYPDRSSLYERARELQAEWSPQS